MRTRVRIISFALAIIAVMGGFIYTGYVEKENLRWQLQATYRQGFGDLVESLNVLSSTLQKGRYAKTKPMLAALSIELTRQSSLASGALSTLPFNTAELEQTAKFLSQVGDYAFYLAKQDAAGGSASESETESLNELANTAYSLSLSLSDLYYSMTEGSLDILALSSDGSGRADPFGESMKQIEVEFPEYAGLIYDGPFSEHISTRTPGYLEGRADVSAGDAKASLAKFFELDEKTIEYTGDAEGTIRAYCFSAPVADGTLYAYVAKQGGSVISMSRDVPSGDAKLKATECVDKARTFMQERGYDDMTESYYHASAGVVTINFAAVQNGVILYPDLIKISVSQSNGQIVGMEARGYLMNHTARALAAVSVPRETAESELSSSFTVEGYNLAIIPTPGQYEKLCHEFICSDTEGQRYLVYINVETGYEEEILILIEDENGTLTI